MLLLVAVGLAGFVACHANVRARGVPTTQPDVDAGPGSPERIPITLKES